MAKAKTEESVDIEIEASEADTPQEPVEVAPPIEAPTVKTITPPSLAMIHSALKFLAARVLSATDMKSFRESFPEVMGE